MRQFLGEREGLAHQTGHALPQCVLETLKMIGFPGFLRTSSVLLCWDHPFIDFILVCMERRLFMVDHRDIGPDLLATGATLISHVKRNNVTCLSIHGNPALLLIRLLQPM